MGHEKGEKILGVALSEDGLSRRGIEEEEEEEDEELLLSFPE